MKCVKLRNNSKLRLKREEDAAMTTSDKINKNDNASQGSRECPISSTPIAIKHIENNVEESLDFNYYTSPILSLCTQEGGNEVAWDWQSSSKKTPESRRKRQNIQCDTPKGTKLLQRKRISNSPLLYKPLKKRTMKMENIENIQFAAELQALNERMKVMKQNEKNCAKNRVEEEAPENLASTSYKEESIEIEDKEQNDKIAEINDCDVANKNGRSGSYDDLFDDSIDDDIIRCTQEMEEKFNMIMDKGNSDLHANIKREEMPCPNSAFDICTNIEKGEAPRTSSTYDIYVNIKKEEVPCTNGTFDNQMIDDQINVKKEEIPCTNGAYDKNSLQYTSNKNSENFKYIHKDMKNGHALRTYSKLSLNKTNSNMCSSAQRDQAPYKSYLNNNMIYSRASRKSSNKTLSRDNITGLFDDSFDDCLATCIEDEELLSGTIRINDSLTHEDVNHETLTRAPLKSGIEFLSTKIEKPSVSPENRKFFKTKSLSDRCIDQRAVTSFKSKTNSSCCPMKSKVSVNSVKSSHTNSASTFTSTSRDSTVTNDRRIENSAIPLTRNTDRTYGFNVDRYGTRGDRDRLVRHHSTGNMSNGTKETTKTGSQPTRCTAEEIEKKRLQAIMRLEAKRKLFPAKITNNINR